jgi:hypothetical protein
VELDVVERILSRNEAGMYAEVVMKETFYQEYTMLK